MSFKIADFRIEAGEAVKLGKRPTKIAPLYKNKADYEAQLTAYHERLDTLQSLQFAGGQYGLLCIVQGMDAAGKDSLIKNLMSGINPQGCQIHSFKSPSAIEQRHDFLWRAVPCLPERGKISVFNRSYYEEVLIVRVHPHFLGAQNLPPALRDEKKIWSSRFRSIADFEHHLHVSGTGILKFYLHISKDEQKKRLLKRIDDSARNWKFSDDDIKERERWPDYMEAYEDCFGKTSTGHAPWYVIPADDKKNARLIVARILLEKLESLGLKPPQTTHERKRELIALRSKLGAS